MGTIIVRLISFSSDAGHSWGAVLGEGIIDLGARLSGLPTLRAALVANALPAVQAEIAKLHDADFSFDQVHLEPVIPDAGQILCIGLNYDEHRIESRRERTGHPTIFARYPQSQIGHEGSILRPPESTMLDYEGELAIIIGETGRRISEQDALSFIAGYACYNDASVRDYQRHTSQFHPGKNFPATGGFGPWMVTADEIPDPTRLTIETRLNGTVVQAAGLDQLIFTIPELIAYCSVFTELRPGDVIVTGTPGGVGTGRTPPLWMKAGDLIEVEIPGVGLLANKVVDEVAVSSVRSASDILA